MCKDASKYLDDSDLNVEQVLALKDLGYSSHAIKSLSNRVKNIDAVIDFHKEHGYSIADLVLSDDTVFSWNPKDIQALRKQGWTTYEIRMICRECRHDVEDIEWFKEKGLTAKHIKQMSNQKKFNDRQYRCLVKKFLFDFNDICVLLQTPYTYSEIEIFKSHGLGAWDIYLLGLKNRGNHANI